VGFIQTGEMFGIGAGFLLVGAVLTWLSWRWVFWLLAILAIAVAFALLRLPEPPRRGERATADERDDPIVREIEAQHVEPDEATVLHADPNTMSLPTAMHEVVVVKTNVIVIVASAIGYFFFAGLRVFAVLFAVKQYAISNSTASLLLPVVGLGAVAGLIAGGRVADMLLRRGVLNARLLVAVVGFVLAAVLLVPVLLVHSVFLALPLLTVGAAGLAAPNPSLDAVRLDVMPPALWGRAESVRTLARTGAEAAAPVLFGFLADHLAGGGHAGLQLTMLIMLPALLANGLVLALATRTYPHDVASAIESIEYTRSAARRSPS
jgi:MFS family permease